MKTLTLALVVSAAALASAQATYNSSTGTFQCARPGVAYCAGESLQTDIIIRCDENGLGQPGRCSDNLAGEPPVGNRPALCWQSTISSGDAACEKNCVVYGGSGNFDGTFTLAANVCEPTFKEPSDADSSAAPCTAGCGGDSWPEPSPCTADCGAPVPEETREPCTGCSEPEEAPEPCTTGCDEAAPEPCTGDCGVPEAAPEPCTAGCGESSVSEVTSQPCTFGCVSSVPETTTPKPCTTGCTSIFSSVIVTTPSSASATPSTTPVPVSSPAVTSPKPIIVPSTVISSWTTKTTVTKCPSLSTVFTVISTGKGTTATITITNGTTPVTVTTAGVAPTTATTTVVTAGTAAATKTPVGPTTSPSATAVVTAGAAANRVGLAMAAVGLIAAYFL